MGKILYYLYENMADFETTFACHILGNYLGKEMVNIAYEKKPLKAASKIQYMPEATVKEVLEMQNIEALIIPGGYERTCKPELIDLIQKTYKKGILIGAICAAPEFLAKAGVLENNLYTTSLDEEYAKSTGKPDVFPRKNYVEKLVVRDKNLITAKGNGFIDFAAEIGAYFNIFEDDIDRKAFVMLNKGMDVCGDLGNKTEI